MLWVRSHGCFGFIIFSLYCVCVGVVNIKCHFTSRLLTRLSTKMSNHLGRFFKPIHTHLRLVNLDPTQCWHGETNKNKGITSLLVSFCTLVCVYMCVCLIVIYFMWSERVVNDAVFRLSGKISVHCWTQENLVLWGGSGKLRRVEIPVKIMKNGHWYLKMVFD